MPKAIVFFLSLMMFNSLVPARVFSQAFFSGQVMAVDHNNMEFIIAPQEVQDGDIRLHTHVLVRISKENVFPDYVKAGNQIRIWGCWEKGKSNVFFASDLKECAGGGCSDATGILYRLKKILGTSDKGSAGKGSGSSGQQSGKGSHGSGNGNGGGGGGGSGGGGGGGGK